MCKYNAAWVNNAQRVCVCVCIVERTKIENTERLSEEAGGGLRVVVGVI